MHRRTFLTTTTAATLAATTSACTGKPHTPGTDPKNPTTTTTTKTTAQTTTATTTTHTAKTPTPTPTTWTALAKSLDGHLIRPGDPAWKSAHQLYNTRFDTLKPTAVAYAAHPDDIRTALSYARAHHIPVAIRNGGHSYAGWSSGNGRLIIDVSKLNRVRASAGEAVIGAGAKLIDVYRALAAKGVTVPAGSCPTVGISGLTLGGGHGVVSRAYGLTCDSLTRATLITADGKEITADAAGDHKDLFWALRGAGNGNFGIVTEFHFRTHPAPRAVSAYMTWPWSKAAAAVRAWQEWGPDQPDEIWSSLHLAAAPGHTPTLSVSAFSLGTYGELQNAVDRLADRIGSSASHVSLKRRTYEESMEMYAGCSSFSTDARCHLPGSAPGHSPEGSLGRETYAARSDFYDRSIPPAGIKALLAQLPRVRGGAGSIAFTALGGAVNRVSPTATAFVHRRSRMLAQYLVSWRPGTNGRAPQSWLDSAYAAMRPYASGAAYQNYTDPDLTDWRKAYYGDAAPRLARLKHQYDPDRVFTYPQAL
ncbi:MULTISPECIES: FAD-binding oxidoreductase [unclassified Streptomyces]|uniref:FAD-binding oxidoreductase n=1 Tax=unclassified Streptomyces TaxID=2593676 RepID=UPI001F3BBCB4|nr:MULTISPECIES: FAD-binding oxidoreductase [unclassified Streptomyces]WKX20178.1 FAD-binding oxidoreductase [Streptomyces sp. HUAS CX7]